MFLHSCEGEAVCKLTNEKVTYTVQPPWLVSLRIDFLLLAAPARPALKPVL